MNAKVSAELRRVIPMNLLILTIIWLLGALGDRLWSMLDNSVPSWDQADYLTGTLNYWQALQSPQWWNGEWWQSFWLLSSKIPPFTYIATAIVQNIFGRGQDEAMLVMLGFSAILLISVYGLGKVLFNNSIGLWAAALCQILPALYRYRLDFVLDYPLASVVTLSFFLLTVWEVQREGQKIGVRRSQKSEKYYSPHPSIPTPLLAAAFGLSFGVALMVKQTALIFLFTPILWVGVAALRHRRWRKLLELVGGLLLSTLVFGWWYRTNWLLILTSGKRATVDSAIAEGDAPLNSLDAWTFYWHQLPSQVSVPLLIVPILGLLFFWGLGKRMGREKIFSFPRSLQWLAIFCVGGYFLSSLNPNKDYRYVLPYLPALSVFLAYGLTCLRGIWGKRIRWGTVGLAVLLMVLNLFFIGGVPGNWVTDILSPKVRYYPYMGEKLPHAQVIAQIIQTEPYLQSTLGVLPSTPDINQHNLNYYGALRNFQVYGRQVGTRESFVEQDARSLSWFITKTGDQGSVRKAQAAMVKAVESGDFTLNKSWELPDGSNLQLYHQQNPPIAVKSLGNNLATEAIALTKVAVPAKAPPGVPVPVTYTWSGEWSELQTGLVILNWRHLTNQNSQWIHDHAIGMGNLHSDVIIPGKFQVVERMSMLPPADIVPGNYTLEATYVNRNTGQSYSIPVPKVTLTIDPQTTPIPAPELDLLTQLRTLGATLPQGTAALDQVFDQVGRINQYDPNQDYLVQIQMALEYRLRSETNKDWAYTLALSNILQRRVGGAIASLEKVTQLDSQNPYAWAYLAFVHLYNWQPTAAQKALKSSLAINPNIREIQALSGVAALMKGNLVQAWQILGKLR